MKTIIVQSLLSSGQSFWLHTQNKQGSYRFHLERFNRKKLNKVEGKVKYRIKVSSRFAALEKFNAEVEINSIWETIKEKCPKFQPQRV
jgi:hypothetical protein